MLKFVEMEDFEFYSFLEKISCSKEEFIFFIDTHNYTFYKWCKNKKFPYYVKLILDTAIKVRYYKELESQGKISNIETNLNEEEIKKLEEENQKLELEIKKYEKIEELFFQTFGFKMES